jgi:hypothetical protein
MRFVDLGPREERVLKHFYRELVTGRAVSMEQMITAMDTPVDKVPMTETPIETAQDKTTKAPRVLRIAAVLAIYTGLGMFLYNAMFPSGWEPSMIKTISTPAPVDENAFRSDQAALHPNISAVGGLRTLPDPRPL